LVIGNGLWSAVTCHRFRFSASGAFVKTKAAIPIPSGPHSKVNCAALSEHHSRQSQSKETNMKAILFICSLGLLFLMITPIVDADIARPKQSPTTSTQSRVVMHTSLEITPDSKIYDARLQIPQSQLQEFRAALDAAAGNTTIAASVTRSSTRTIIAGVLLFLSLSFGGVWLARSRNQDGTSRTTKAIAAAVIAIGTIGAAAIITRGNAGPPGYYRWRNLPQALKDGRSTAAGVDIEIVADDPNGGSGIKLLIPIRKGNQGEE
jgi:hypothetical protein